MRSLVIENYWSTYTTEASIVKIAFSWMNAYANLGRHVFSEAFGIIVVCTAAFEVSKPHTYDLSRWSRVQKHAVCLKQL